MKPTRGAPWRTRSSRRCWPATSSASPTRWSCARWATTSSTPATACAARASTPTGVQLDYGKLLTELRPAAEASVRQALLLEAIGEKEEIAVGDAEIEAEIERYARASQRPAPAVRRMMEKSGDLDALRHGMRERKTLDMLIEHARVSA